MRDLESGTIEVARRDTLTKESRPLDGIVDHVTASARRDPGEHLSKRRSKFREENTFRVDTWDEFKDQIEKGGFILAHWDGTAETEEKIKDETKATIRCIPLNSTEEAGKDVYSGKESPNASCLPRAY